MATIIGVIGFFLALSDVNAQNVAFDVDLSSVPEHFYPFGPDVGDAIAPINDDDSTDRISIDVAFPFYEDVHNHLFVSKLIFGETIF